MTCDTSHILRQPLHQSKEATSDSLWARVVSHSGKGPTCQCISEQHSFRPVVLAIHRDLRHDADKLGSDVRSDGLALLISSQIDPNGNIWFDRLKDVETPCFVFEKSTSNVYGHICTSQKFGRTWRKRPSLWDFSEMVRNSGASQAWNIDVPKWVSIVSALRWSRKNQVRETSSSESSGFCMLHVGCTK